MDATPRPSRRLQADTTSAVGWRLDDAERAALLERFAPVYPDVIADHVTLKMNVRSREPLPEPCLGVIVGEADDGAGLQCLVVEVGGGCERWDGGVYHITWSLDRARKRRPIESNGVIAWLGWRAVERVTITLTPGRF
jgi:hypothetical protein